MNTLLFVVCVSGLVALASAHMCLLHPKQRGSIAHLSMAGSTDCILLNGPCGGRAMEMPRMTYKEGDNYTVIFQKNLDHWSKASPGYFGVNLWKGTMSKELQRVPDNGEPSLTVYTATGMLPMGMTGDLILQVTYVTKNPQAPVAFYQCSDITVTAGPPY